LMAPAGVIHLPGGFVECNAIFLATSYRQLSPWRKPWFVGSAWWQRLWGCHHAEVWFSNESESKLGLLTCAEITVSQLLCQAVGACTGIAPGSAVTSSYHVQTCCHKSSTICCSVPYPFTQLVYKLGGILSLQHLCVGIPIWHHLYLMGRNRQFGLLF